MLFTHQFRLDLIRGPIRKTSHLTFTCSKITIEALEKCVIYMFKVKNQKIRTSQIVEFEQVNVSWVLLLHFICKISIAIFSPTTHTKISEVVVEIKKT